MAGLGILFAGISGAGRALASSAEQDQRVNDTMRMEAERSRLEEQKILRIAEAKRNADRAAGMQQGVEIQGATAEIQNQRDAEAINAQYGSQMSAADAQVLRANPEARKAYGLLASSRQTDLEDRARAAENLGYLDAAGETRRQLQTEIGNERNKNLDEDAKRRADQQDKRLEAEIDWRKSQAELAARREDRQANIQSAELAFRKSQASKNDAQASSAAEAQARMATQSALKGAEQEVKALAKEAADPMLAPEQKEIVQQQLTEARNEAKRYRTALAGAGLEGSQAPSKPFDPADFAIGGQKPAAGGSAKASTVANPFGSPGVADPRKGEISEAVERKPRAPAPAETKTQAAAPAKSQYRNRVEELAAGEARERLTSLQRAYDAAVEREQKGRDQGGAPGLKLRREAEVRAAKAALDEAKAKAR